MTDADIRAEIDRELALCLDTETRAVLMDARMYGPGSHAWRQAITIVGLRAVGREVMASASREDVDQVWLRIEERLEQGPRARSERRGQLVAILGDIAIVATCAGALLVALWCAVLAIWGWL
jgi:hypothetical protein